MEEYLRVGELAKRSGLTVRTLHHYDEIGLLSPSHRTESGYRLYGPQEVSRLVQLMALKRVGFSLEAIRELFSERPPSLMDTLKQHQERLKQQIADQQMLLHRLETACAQLTHNETLSMEDVTQLLEVMSMIESYYTPEQLEQLKERAALVGEERMQQVQEEWKQLFARFQEESEKGSAPDSDTVQELAKKALGLIREFTGGDPGISRSLNRMYEQEGPSKVLRPHGFALPEEAFALMNQAMAIAGQNTGS